MYIIVIEIFKLFITFNYILKIYNKFYMNNLYYDILIINSKFDDNR